MSLLPFLMALLVIFQTVHTARAHPHVWVAAQAHILYKPDGKISAIRHSWTFDAAYSAFSTQGLDTNKDGQLSREELADLAKTNVESLIDFDYFTVLKAQKHKAVFSAPQNYYLHFEQDSKALTLHFTLPLQEEIIGGTIASLEIYDPTYFVEFRIKDGDQAVQLDQAPKGCTMNISRPKPPDIPAANNGESSPQLSEQFFEALTASSNFGVQFANRVIIACP
jgi:ABC-type uncharacterized transport system substrate-binding protein